MLQGNLCNLRLGRFRIQKSLQMLINLYKASGLGAIKQMSSALYRKITHKLSIDLQYDSI